MYAPSLPFISILSPANNARPIVEPDGSFGLQDAPLASGLPSSAVKVHPVSLSHSLYGEGVDKHRADCGSDTSVFNTQIIHVKNPIVNVRAPGFDHLNGINLRRVLQNATPWERGWKMQPANKVAYRTGRKNSSCYFRMGVTIAVLSAIGKLKMDRDKQRI